MSTSTLTNFDTFDTHMLDYSNDTDMPMYAGAIMTESWLPAEDIMEDDSSNSRSEPIEIEMATSEGEVEEYDMADGEEAPQDGDQELVDVDVADEPHIASPSMLPVDAAPSLSADASHFLQPPSMLSSALPSPVVQHADVSAVSLENSWLEQASSEAPIPAVVDISVSSTSHPEEETPAPSSTVPNIDAAGEEPDLSGARGAEDSLRDDIVANQTDLTGGHEAEESSKLNAEVYPSEGAEDRAPDVPPAHDEHFAEPTVLEVHQSDAAGHSEQQVYEVYETYEETQEATASSETHQEPHEVVVSGDETSEVVTSSEAQEAHYEVSTGGEVYETEQAATSGDPHEISEGVFIDPPPAVLLEVSLPSGRVEYSFFNQPASGSASQTPTAEAPGESSGLYSLILQERPTLYYEPLSNVFAALRQHEIVNTSAELADGELILDAYDLQLVASEDNVYMHDVTLHELNILHDGADLSGPLRLRLYARSPRFITRYNALREQISRLEISEESQDDTLGEVYATEGEQTVQEQEVALSPEEGGEPCEGGLHPEAEQPVAQEEPVPAEETTLQVQESQLEESTYAQVEEFDEQEHAEHEISGEPEADANAVDFDSVNVDDAVADDTTEGTETGDQLDGTYPVDKAEQDSKPSEEAFSATQEDFSASAEQEGEVSGYTAEIAEPLEATTLLENADIESHEFLNYDADTANSANARIDQGTEETISTSYQQPEDSLRALQPEAEDALQDYYETDADGYHFEENEQVIEERPIAATEVLPRDEPSNEDNYEGADPSWLTQPDVPPESSTDIMLNRSSKRTHDLVEPDFEDYEGDESYFSSPELKKQRMA